MSYQMKNIPSYPLTNGNLYNLKSSQTNSIQFSKCTKTKFFKDNNKKIITLPTENLKVN